MPEHSSHVSTTNGKIRKDSDVFDYFNEGAKIRQFGSGTFWQWGGKYARITRIAVVRGNRLFGHTISGIPEKFKNHDWSLSWPHNLSLLGSVLYCQQCLMRNNKRQKWCLLLDLPWVGTGSVVWHFSGVLFYFHKTVQHYICNRKHRHFLEKIGLLLKKLNITGFSLL
jgi:hypothetical protein